MTAQTHIIPNADLADRLRDYAANASQDTGAERAAFLRAAADRLDAPLAGVFIRGVRVKDLQPGMVLVSCGRAMHLRKKTGHVGGYDQWSYDQHGTGMVYSGTTGLLATGEADVLVLPATPPR